MRSIRRSLTLRLALGGALLWAGCGLGIYLAVRASLLGEFDHALLAKAQALGSLVEQQDDGQAAMNLADEWMPQFANQPSADFFQLWSAAGRTLERSESLRKRDLPRRTGPRERPVYWDFDLLDHGKVRAVGVRFAPSPDEDHKDKPRQTAQAAPEVFLVVASRRERLDHFLTLLQAALLGSAAIMLAGSAVLAAWAARRGLAPLAVVAERARAIDADAPGTRFPTLGMPAELLPICERLNESLTRLEASFERERRFSADVAHELRTPIAELRSLAEVTLKWPSDGESSGEALRDALDIALQMEAAVVRLLALVRCESGAQTVQQERVVLAEVVQRAWQPLNVQALAKQLKTHFDVRPDFRLEADPALLLGIVSNLLNNAVTYTPDGGSIAVRLETGNGPGALIIENSPVDLQPSDLPHLFERYWRKDAARHAADHTGLGLALARAFARALGMRLNAALTRPAALQMRLEGVGSSAASVSPTHHLPVISVGSGSPT